MLRGNLGVALTEHLQLSRVEEGARFSRSLQMSIPERKGARLNPADNWFVQCGGSDQAGVAIVQTVDHHQYGAAAIPSRVVRGQVAVHLDRAVGRGG